MFHVTIASFTKHLIDVKIKNQTYLTQITSYSWLQIQLTIDITSYGEDRNSLMETALTNVDRACGPIHLLVFSGN